MKKLSLTAKLNLTLVLPLSLIAVLVTYISQQNLDANWKDLAEALSIEAQTQKVYSLLLVQQEASKAILIDTDRLAQYTEKKLDAYDEHVRLLSELHAKISDPQIKAVFARLKKTDAEVLRPLDTAVLEKMFEDEQAARAMFFEKYEPAQAKYAQDIRTLETFAKSKAKAAAASMVRANGIAVLQIAAALVLGIIAMVFSIFILGTRVERSQKNVQALLQGIDEGLFFFDKTGAIGAERSSVLSGLVPGMDEVHTLQDFNATVAGRDRESADLVLEFLWPKEEDEFESPFEGTVACLPSKLVYNEGAEDEQIIRLEYRPYRDDNGKLQRVYVSARDITDALRAEKDAVRQRERIQRLSVAASDPQAFLFFAKETEDNVEMLGEGLEFALRSGDGIPKIKRLAHTIKGITRLYGFDGLASDVHGFEDLLEEMSASNDDGAIDGEVLGQKLEKWKTVRERWVEEAGDIKSVLGLSRAQEEVSVERGRLEALRAMADAVDYPELRRAILDISRVPISTAFRRHEKNALALAQRRGKKLRIDYVGGSCRVDSEELAQISGAIAHIVSNMVDHGIEDPSERSGTGKGDIGIITVATERAENGLLSLSITDDGKGIDGDRLAQKMVESGRWDEAQYEAASIEEKVALIFEPSLSSADAVSETSGRGVGMSAVKEIVEELGGQVHVTTALKKGCTVKLRIPAQRPDANRQKAA